jgi:hypothetical protein
MFGFCSLLEKSKLIYCFKNDAGKVLYQNKACIDLCGNMIVDTSPCNKFCMKKIIKNSEYRIRNDGIRHFPCQLNNEKYYDITIICDGSFLISILYPLEERHAADFKYFSGFEKLTPRETEILALIIRRFSNNDICAKLELKKNTLKKYLMNIYQKLPREAVMQLRNN